MAVAGGSPATTPALETLTSTPRAEAQPPLPPSPGRPEKIVSSSSLKDENSEEEDWLIKVFCPGARKKDHSSSQSRKPTSIEFQKNLDKEDESAGSTSSTSYQIYQGVPRKKSSELEWLMRVRCPGAQMEPRISDQKPSLPEACSSRKSIQSEKPMESWLSEKHLSAMQASVRA